MYVPGRVLREWTTISSAKYLQLSKILPLQPRVSRNKVLHDSIPDRNSVFLISTFPVNQTFFSPGPFENEKFSSVQPLNRLVRRRGGGQEGRFSRDPLPGFSVGGHCDQLWHGMSTLRCCPSSILSADHGVAHRPRCPEG